MNDTPCYLTLIIWGGVSHYLLWVDGGDSSDHFVTRQDRSIYLALNESDALNFSRENNINASCENIYKFSLDELWNLLSRTKQIKELTKNDCKVILDAWNILEDLAETLNIKIPPYQKSKKRAIQEIYEKIFSFADILNREAADYCELSLSRRERGIARSFLGGAWKKIHTHRHWGY